MKDKCKVVDQINWQFEELSALEEPKCYEIDED